VLAEDDCDTRTMLASALRSDGLEVLEVADGSALKKLLGSTFRGTGGGGVPDLIVTDVRMPGLTGLEVLEELRRRDWATPVILITAFDDRATQEEARRLGAAAVFRKPFALEDLETAIVNLVAA
jgi:CheY-like chemotaxis protein